jgi:hypothetical protein
LVELDFCVVAALSSNGLTTAGDVPAQRESTLPSLIFQGRNRNTGDKPWRTSLR